MAKEFFYDTSSPDGAIVVTTADTPSDVGGLGQGYAVTNISGTYKGEAITGLVGVGGAIQTDGTFKDGTYDNTVFVSASQGNQGSLDGIDYDGIDFRTADGTDHILFGGGNLRTLAYLESADTNGTQSKSTLSDYNEVVCFTTGALIRTARGDVAVETLAAGDMAVTASGVHRPITWVGHRTIERPGFAQQPMRIAAGAFGAGLPKRELRLSPGHPVLVGADEDGRGGHLVPAMCLINGTSIARMAVDGVTYWHVELDRHDILLAEGLPAESFLDWGCREWFGADAAAHALANPDFVVPGLAGRCRPVAVDGPVVEAERRRLDALFEASLAAHCAWPDEQAGALAF